MDFICCVIYMHDEEIDKGISYKRMSILRLVMSCMLCMDCVSMCLIFKWIVAMQNWIWNWIGTELGDEHKNNRNINKRKSSTHLFLCKYFGLFKSVSMHVELNAMCFRLRWYIACDNTRPGHAIPCHIVQCQAFISPIYRWQTLKERTVNAYTLHLSGGNKFEKCVNSLSVI